MSKFLLTFILTLTFLIGKSQINVDGTDINQLEEVQMCMIIGTSKFFSSKIIVTVDYGQKKTMKKPGAIKNEDGKNKDFNSMIDAANFFSKNGWEFVNAYAINNGNGGSVYNFLFKKKPKE